MSDTGPAKSLPCTCFATSQDGGADRFEAWRASISVLFDTAPLTHDTLETFQASVHATHLGQLLLGDLRFGAQRFARGSARAARDGLDHYLVQWYRQGGFIGQYGDSGSLRLSGTRFYSTGALFAHWIPSRAEDEQGRTVLVFAPRHAEGVRVVDDWSGIGQRTTASGSVQFSGVEVDADDVLPVWQLIDRPGLSGPASQLIQAAIDAGIAQAAIDDTLRFVREFHPEPEAVDMYDRMMPVFERVYTQAQSVYDDLDRLAAPNG